MTELLEFLRTHEEAFRSRARLASLYSDFRSQRHTNPDGYQANANVWLRALSAAAKDGLIPAPSSAQPDRYVLHTGEQLLQALQTPELGRPLALGCVVEDAVKKKQLVPLQDFVTRSQSAHATSWLPKPWEVVTWTLRHIGVLGGEMNEGTLVAGDFVVVANVEAAAKQVIDHVAKTAASNSARIFSTALFHQMVATALGVELLSQRDTAVLLVHLAGSCAAIAYDAGTGTVKFKALNETKPTPVTEDEIAIGNLRGKIVELQKENNGLAQIISQLDTQTREAVAKKQLIIAKTSLRQKKLAETKLQQRTAMLLQLEETYAKLEQAADNVEMVRILAASSKTLKSLNEKTGGVDKVQDIAEGLREEMLTADEIQQAISDVSANAIDENEVDEELEELEEAERKKNAEAERQDKEKREAEEVAEVAKRLAALDAPKEDAAQKDESEVVEEQVQRRTEMVE